VKPPVVGFVADFEFDRCLVCTAPYRDTIAPESRHKCLKKGGTIRGVPPGKNGDTRRKRRLGFVDSANVLDLNLGLFIRNPLYHFYSHMALIYI